MNVNGNLRFGHLPLSCQNSRCCHLGIWGSGEKVIGNADAAYANTAVSADKDVASLERWWLGRSLCGPRKEVGFLPLLCELRTFEG